MTQLGVTDRRRIWMGLMRYWSNLRETCAMNKSDLLDAVASTDTWIDDNTAAFNTALPVAARNGLTATQKTLLFCCVALMRVNPGMAALLQRALGVEVD